MRLSGRCAAAIVAALLYVQVSPAQGIIRSFDGGTPGDHLGLSVASAGDVNADGYSDIICGAPSADPGGLADAGQVIVYSGFDSSVLYTFDGVAAGDLFGQSVSGAGDSLTMARDMLTDSSSP